MSSLEDAERAGIIAGLDWTKEQVLSLIKNYKNRDILFVQDKEVVEATAEKRNQPEHKNFTKYIKDNKILTPFLLGLQLRSLENSGDEQKAEKLKRKILEKFKSQGLYIAFFAQNGIFTRLHAYLVENSKSEEEVKIHITDFFRDFRRHVEFIHNPSSPIKKFIKQKAKEITSRINATLPDIFVLSSAWGAQKYCARIKDSVMSKIKDNYYTEKYESEIGNRGIYFIIQKESSI